MTGQQIHRKAHLKRSIWPLAYDSVKIAQTTERAQALDQGLQCIVCVGEDCESQSKPEGLDSFWLSGPGVSFHSFLSVNPRQLH
jgi:hypothetical protein